MSLHGEVRRKFSLVSRTGESGVTLLEVLVTTTIMVVTLAAVLVALEAVSRQEPRISHHGLRTQAARAALERMTRELRQSYSINASSSTSIDVLTYIRGGPGQSAGQQRVVLDCGTDGCSRQAGPVGGALGSVQTVFTGVVNSDIFTYLPNNVNPRYVRIKFTFDVKHNQTDPADPVTLSAGVKLRNVSTPD